MELIYGAMLLHEAKKEINEVNVKKVLEAVGIKKDDAQIRALVASLSEIDIDKAIKEAAMPVAVAPAKEEKSESKKVESKEDEKKSEEKAAAGLSALFG